MSPSRNIITGYLLIAIAGTLLLAIPAFQLVPIGWTDHLFIAVSSLSTTGLDSVGVGQTYNFGGQLIMVLLMQVGGIGYMSFAVLWLMKVHKKWGTGEAELIKKDLGLPIHYNFIDIVKVKIVISLVVESIGALVLFLLFSNAGVENAAWSAIFHSVSAFCTVGLSLFPDQLEQFSNNPGIMMTLAGLGYIGAIGFIVFSDIWQRLRHKRKELSYTSKVILKTSTIGIIFGTALLYLIEPSFRSMSLGEGWMTAFFQTVSAGSTMGFNSVPLENLLRVSIFLLIIVMMIGSSPTGTGGGIKLTTFSIVLAQIKSTFNQTREVSWENTIIPDFKVRMALSTFSCYMILLITSIWLFSFLEPKVGFEAVFFEVTSALSNVGLTLELTPKMGDGSKLLLSFVMFIGRIGILSLGLAFMSAHLHKENKPHHDIAI